LPIANHWFIGANSIYSTLTVPPGWYLPDFCVLGIHNLVKNIELISSIRVESIRPRVFGIHDDGGWGKLEVKRFWVKRSFRVDKTSDENISKY